MNKRQFFTCECGETAISVEPMDDDTFPIGLAFWRVGYDSNSFRERVRIAWLLLRNELFADEVLLSRKETKRFAKYLIALANREHTGVED